MQKWQKKDENHYFFVKIFDIYEKYCNFAKKFFGNADKEIKSLIF